MVANNAVEVMPEGNELHHGRGNVPPCSLGKGD